MLTLADINAATNSYDGDIYSDLYKDVFGCRPRYATFESVEDFDKDFERLVNMLNEQQEREAIQQAENWTKFVTRVVEVMSLVQGCDRNRAVEIIAEAEDELDEYRWYGPERLEWCFNLKFGSIKKWLNSTDE